MMKHDDSPIEHGDVHSEVGFPEGNPNILRYMKSWDIYSPSVITIYAPSNK